MKKKSKKKEKKEEKKEKVEHLENSADFAEGPVVFEKNVFRIMSTTHEKCIDQGFW